MFTKLKKDQRQPLIDMLAFVVAGTQGAAGHALIPLNQAKRIVLNEPGLIELKGEVPDANGNVPAIATPQGIAACQKHASGGAAAQAPASTSGKRTFELEDGLPIPERKRGGLKESLYPFATMSVGQSFFLPQEGDKDMLRSMSSAVSGANKRFASTYPMTQGRNKTPHPKAGQPTGKDGRKFTVRERTAADNDPKGVGVRVYRVS